MNTKVLPSRDMRTPPYSRPSRDQRRHRPLTRCRSGRCLAPTSRGPTTSRRSPGRPGSSRSLRFAGSSLPFPGPGDQAFALAPSAVPSTYQPFLLVTRSWLPSRLKDTDENCSGSAFTSPFAACRVPSSLPPPSRPSRRLGHLGREAARLGLVDPLDEDLAFPRVREPPPVVGPPQRQPLQVLARGDGGTSPPRTIFTSLTVPPISS